MAGHYGTDVDVMARVARDIEGLNEQIRSGLRTLQSQVASLEGQWRGAGASSFQARMLQWNEGAARMNRNLDQIAQQVRSSGGLLAQQEENARSLFAGAGDGAAPGGTAPAASGAEGQGFGRLL